MTDRWQQPPTPQPADTHRADQPKPDRKRWCDPPPLEAQPAKPDRSEVS